MNSIERNIGVMIFTYAKKIRKKKELKIFISNTPLK